MNLRQFQSILAQSILLPVAGLLLVAFALGLQIRSAERTVTLIQLTDGAAFDLSQIEKLIVDEETGLRGYEITTDPQFLKPYNDAQPQLEAAFTRLRSLLAPYPQVQPRIQALYNAHQIWHQSFAEPIIDTIRAGGQANDDQINLTGKKQMDAMRSSMTGMLTLANRVRNSSVERWQSQVRYTLETLVGCALALGLLLGFFIRNRLKRVSTAFESSLNTLRRQAQEVFESEQKLRITLSSIGDGVIVCDTEGRVEMLNGIAQELTGWTQDESFHQPIETVFNIVNESTRLLVENPVAKVKRLNRVVGLANHTVLLRRDGTEVNIDDSGAPIRDSAGALIGIVMVFRDITMERRTQAALIANEKLAVAGRLAATIAHEIHNPLDSVANLLYLMRNTSSPEENRQFLETAQQELARVTQISRSMLGLYRESKSAIPVDLKEILDGILLLMERRFADLKVQVEASVPANIIVQGFPAELRQVFTNLIANAAEASAPNGHVRISIAGSMDTDPARPNRHGVLIEIADDGPGIPSDIQSKLFQPFFTTKGEQGTGLGLWVSRGIVQKHDGAITLTSSMDPAAHGTAVRIFLPSKLGALTPASTH